MLKFPRATDEDGGHEGDPHCRRAMMMRPYDLMKASQALTICVSAFFNEAPSVLTCHAAC